MLCCLAMGCAAQRGAAYQLFTNKEGSVKPVENKNMSKLVIGVLVALVLLLGGYIAVSGTARGGKSAATANGSTGASEAAARHGRALRPVEKDRRPTPCSGL